MSDGEIAQRVVTSTSVMFQFGGGELRGRCRKRGLTLARHVAMYLIRQETCYNLVDVGREMGFRTPASVSYAYQKIAKSLCVNPQLRVKVAEIKKLVFEEN